MSDDLSSLIEQKKLQDIVDIQLEAIPLRCPQIENYKWTSGPPARLIAASGQIERIELENALDAEAIVRRKVFLLVEAFREQVALESKGYRRTLMDVLRKPTIRVELHEPPPIWVMKLGWEVNFETSPASNVLPVKWIAVD